MIIVSSTLNVPTGGQVRFFLWPKNKESPLKVFFETRVLDNVTILDCKGRFAYRDEATAFSEKVAELLPRAREVVIDLGRVEMIDSAGLGELVVVHMWARASGCTLKLAGANERIQRLFELTNLSSVFELYTTVDDAVRTFREPPANARTASNAA
jgi:anti-sigma B factor antagonist